MSWLKRFGIGLAWVWFASLVVASYQLQVWQERLVRVLVHLQADELLQAKALAAGQGLRSSWYHDRTVALLQAVEHLQEPSVWTVVMPGSWRIFDDLEIRATQRIEQAFRRIVVETLRREIEKRAAQIAGAALDPYTEALDPDFGCRGPSMPARMKSTLEVAQMPEFEAMARFLEEARRMDEAVASLHALLSVSRDDGAALQRVIQYSLGISLSGPASRSLALLRHPQDAADPLGEALTRRLGQALRCSARAGMGALQARMILHNPLLASERAIRDATTPYVLFPSDRNPDEQAFAQRIQVAIQRIEEQRTLLASADMDWMDPQARGLGAAHGSLLTQIGRIPLLGPGLVMDLDKQVRVQREHLRAEMDHFTASVDAGLAWDATQGRVVQTQRRIAMRAGLIALLKTPPTAAPVSADPAQRLERPLAQGVSCGTACGPLSRRAPPAPWDSAGEFAAPVSSAD